MAMQFPDRDMHVAHDSASHDPRGFIAAPASIKQNDRDDHAQRSINVGRP